MQVPPFLRQPAFLLSVVASLIALTWFVLGRPTLLPQSPLGAKEKLDCVSYSPFRGKETPAAGIIIPPERIEQDLAALTPLTNCLRTYTTAHGLDRVPELARKRGLGVVMGVAISRNAAENKAEIDRALAAVNAQRPAIRALVAGNEVIARGEMTPAELSALIRQLRQASRMPVTYADNAETWLRLSELGSLVDHITVNFSPYAMPRPLTLGGIGPAMRDIRTKLATQFPGKEVVFAEAGWPSAGRMRGHAHPSPRNQALAVHEMLAATKGGNFRVHLYEAFDQPWRTAQEGTAGANFGLLDGDTRAAKFRFGAELRNHPLWFYQAVIGILFALVVFAAGYLGARITGPVEVKRIDWLPVAAVALAAGVMIGAALIESVLQNQTLLDWVHSGFIACLALVVPPVCASALIRGSPRETFSALLDPLLRSVVDPLSRIVMLFHILVTLAAIELSLGLIFDPATRDFHHAALTAPVISLFVVALVNPRGYPREAIAETLAAILLVTGAVFIFFSERAWNWHALWLEALLLVLAWTLASARAGRRRE